MLLAGLQGVNQCFVGRVVLGKLKGPIAEIPLQSGVDKNYVFVSAEVVGMLLLKKSYSGLHIGGVRSNQLGMNGKVLDFLPFAGQPQSEVLGAFLNQGGSVLIDLLLNATPTRRNWAKVETRKVPTRVIKTAKSNLARIDRTGSPLKRNFVCKNRTGLNRDKGGSPNQIPFFAQDGVEDGKGFRIPAFLPEKARGWYSCTVANVRPWPPLLPDIR